LFMLCSLFLFRSTSAYRWFASARLGLLLVCGTLLALTAHAQTPRYPIGGLPHWEWQIPQPTGFNLNVYGPSGTHFFSDSSLIAVGAHGTAVRTRDARGRCCRCPLGKTAT
jgi:hypothetical protein